MRRATKRTVPGDRDDYNMYGDRKRMAVDGPARYEPPPPPNRYDDNSHQHPKSTGVHFGSDYRGSKLVTVTDAVRGGGYDNSSRGRFERPLAAPAAAVVSGITTRRVVQEISTIRSRPAPPPPSPPPSSRDRIDDRRVVDRRDER